MEKFYSTAFYSTFFTYYLEMRAINIKSMYLFVSTCYIESIHSLLFIFTGVFQKQIWLVSPNLNVSINVNNVTSTSTFYVV